MRVLGVRESFFFSQSRSKRKLEKRGKLTLSLSLSLQPLNSLLDMEIVQERLEREYGLNLIRTAPSVAYRVKLRKTGGSKEEKELAAAAAKNGSGDGDGGDSDPLLISVDNPASIPVRFFLLLLFSFHLE